MWGERTLLADVDVRCVLWRLAEAGRAACGPGMVLLDAAGGPPGYATVEELGQFRFPFTGWAVAAHDRLQPVAVICLLDPNHERGGSIYFLDDQLIIEDVVGALLRHYDSVGKGRSRGRGRRWL